MIHALHLLYMFVKLLCKNYVDVAFLFTFVVTFAVPRLSFNNPIENENRLELSIFLIATLTGS